ncbi:sensor histidine kinase [Novosphingobium sp. JCM 18896]|uniref:sensor histidine kinase n=1 Tax=Novosphingobium sp. JCM 18896 TaxID=2989731 RepID=UPI002221AFB9|nr:sensor histidine kinase [Novosphingobium sp. JCM 18896]
MVTVLPGRHEPSPADEANHRIANSLQLLSAMVATEARTLSDPAGLAALQAIGRRIAAMAGVHRLLCHGPARGTIDLAAYMADLVRGLTAMGSRPVVLEAEPVTVAAEEAGAIGMILSELVNNAAKHAYAAHQPGGVAVALRPHDEGGYRVEVTDRGRGLAQGARGTGLGSELIQLLARRLGATCHCLDAMPGTHFVLDVTAR